MRVRGRTRASATTPGAPPPQPHTAQRKASPRRLAFLLGGLAAAGLAVFGSGLAGANTVKTVTLVPGGSGQGVVDFTQHGYADALAALDGDTLSLAVPLAGTPAVPLPDLTLSGSTVYADTATATIAVEGTATLPWGTSLPVLVTSSWGGSGAPTVTVGVRADGATLSALNPDWTRSDGTTFGSAELVYSSTDGTLDPATLPLEVRGFYDPALCGGTTIPLTAGVSFCGGLHATGPLATGLTALGMSGDATVTGTLGGPAVLFGQGAGGLDGLHLTAALAAGPSGTGPGWLTGTSLTADFAVADGEASLTLAGQTTLTVGSVSDRFSGEVGLATDGSFKAVLDAVGTPVLPFGLDKLGTKVDAAHARLELSLGGDGPDSTVAGDLALSYRPTGADAPLELKAGILVDGDTVTATIGVGTEQPDGSLGPVPAPDLLALGGDLLGLTPPALPGADRVTVDHASLTLSSGADGTVVSVGGGATVGGISGSLLLSVRDQDGSAVPLLGVHLAPSQGTSLADLFPGVHLGGLVQNLALPTVDLTVAGGEFSVAAGDLTAEEKAFFTTALGTLPQTVTAPAGLALTAQVPTDAFGPRLAQLLGYDGTQSVVLSGTLGGSVGLSDVGGPSADLTGLDLKAVLPETSSAPEILGGLVTHVDETTFEVTYRDGTLEGSLDTGATLAIAGQTIPTTLSASASTADGGSVHLVAAIPDWQHPFGLQWVASADANVTIDATFGGDEPTFTAAAAAEVKLGTAAKPMTFGLSADLSVKQDDTSLTVHADFDGTASLADVAALFPELTGFDGDLATNDALSALSVGPVHVTAVVSAEPSLEVAASAQLKLPGAANPLQGDLLVEAKDGSFTFGVKASGATLADFLPPDTLQGADQLALPDAALVLTDATDPVPAADLGTHEYDFFKTLYGCPKDGTPKSCTDFTTLDIGSGLTFVSSMTMPQAVADEAAQIGIKLPPPGQGAVLTVKGTVPVFGDGKLSLSASLTDVTLPNAPDWFPSGHVSLSISTDGITLKGGMTLTIPRLLAPAGAPCDEGGTSVDFGGTSYCSDQLDFDAELQVQFPTSGEPAIQLSGVMNKLNSTGADTTTYWQPFGIQGVGVHRLAVSLTVTMSATETPEVAVGFQGDFKVGTFDIAGAIDVGLTVLQAPPYVRPDLLGVSLASASGLSLGDLVKLADSTEGAGITDQQVAQLPNVGLKNVSIQFAQQNNEALCLTTGFHFSADLYAGTTITSDGTSPAVPSYSDPSGCRKLLPPPKPENDCHHHQADGCVASVFGTVDENGLVAQGQLNGFSVGLISFDTSTLDLELTAAKQHLTLIGGASLTASNGYQVAKGYANLDFGLNGLHFLSNASLLNDTIHGFVEADAPLDLANPHFSMKVWLKSDISAAINGAIANTLSQIKPLVLDVSTIVKSMDTNGGIPDFATFNALMQDTAHLTGIPVPQAATDLVNSAAWVQQQLKNAGLAINLDWILKGIKLPDFPGTPGIYTPPGCYAIYAFGICWGIQVNPPGLCAFVFVNGTCYGIPPITGPTIPGICQDIGISPSDPACSWSGLLSRFVLSPALQAINKITGLNLQPGSDSTNIDQLIDWFSRPQPSLFSLNCAEFSASGEDLANFGQGTVNVKLAADATVLGRNFSGGLQWNLGNVNGDVGAVVQQVFDQLFHPQPVTCDPEPTTAILTSATVPPPPPAQTLAGVLSASTVLENDQVTFLGTFGVDRSGGYPQVKLAWGDGTTDTIPAGGSKTVAATHTYRTAGPTGSPAGHYVVTATVQDDGASTVQLPVEVDNVAPTVTAVNLAGNGIVEGGTAELSGAFTDAGSSDTHAVTVDWGDGSPADTLTLPAEDRTFSASHRYLDDPASGTSFPVAVTVADEHGGTGRGSASQAVAEAVPTDLTVTPKDVVAGAGVQPDGSVQVVEGSMVSYHVAFADTAPADLHKVTVDWGDGSDVSTVSLGAGVTETDIAHQYHEDGVFRPQVTVTDQEMAVTTDASGSPVSSVVDEDASATAAATVNVLDAALTAGEPTSLTATEGNAFSGPVGTFTDGNTAAPPDDFTATVHWGDGTSTPGTVTVDQTGVFTVAGDHTYAEEGTYGLSVEVLDKGGSAVALSGTVTVADAPLTAGAPVTVRPVEGNAFSGVVATFADGNPAAPAADFTATVDWGDGTKPSAGTLVSDGTPGGFTVTGTHTYAEEGTHPVSVTVVDEGHSTVALSGTAKVADAPLTAGDPVTVRPVEGNAFSGVVATFADGNPAAPAADFTATVDWGDGTKPSAGTVVSDGTPGGFTVAGTHTYAEEGSYRVTVTVVDEGGSTVVPTGTAKVADAALAATGDPRLFSTDPVRDLTVASFTDENPAAPAADFTATVDWGDGTAPSAGTVHAGAEPGSFTVSGSHTYAALGPYTLTVRIRDEGGSTAAATSSLMVYGLTAGGNFVVGDASARQGAAVTFWGAQWARQNSLSGGAAPSAFKGWAPGDAPPTLGSTWSARTGNSGSPAATVPSYVAVTVASAVRQAGSTLTGDTVHVVIVRTDPGYSTNPGHPGTGTVVAVMR